MQILNSCILSLLIFLFACVANHSINQEINLTKIFGEGTRVEGPFSIEQAEKDNMITVEKDGKSVILPFGYINDKWEAFKTKYQDGDQIYKFSSSKESWEKLAGREGYSLIRDDQIIAEIITLMN